MEREAQLTPPAIHFDNLKIGQWVSISRCKVAEAASFRHYNPVIPMAPYSEDSKYPYVTPSIEYSFVPFKIIAKDFPWIIAVGGADIAKISVQSFDVRTQTLQKLNSRTVKAFYYAQRKKTYEIFPESWQSVIRQRNNYLDL